MDEQDADFDQLPSPVPEETASSTPVADSLADVIGARLEKVQSGKTRGDQLAGIMRSVEKLMFVQTELLTNISDKIEKQLTMQVERNEDADRISDTGSVSDEDTTPVDSDKGNLLKELASKLSGGTKGAKGLAKILGKVALAAAVGPYVFQFIKGFITQSLENLLGISEETADSVAGPLSMGVLFGGIAKFFGFRFFPALIGGITFGLVKKLDTDEDGEIAGMSANIVAGLAAGIATTLSYFHKWTFGMLKKGFSKIGNGVRSLMGFPVKVDDVIPDTMPPKPTKPGAKPPKPPALPKPPSLPTAKPPPVPKGVEKLKIPGALRVTPGGSVPPTTAKGVMQALKDSGRLAQLAKYSKFLKFAGPAMAVIPALIEPIQAIYNDEPGDVIATQVSGALGSIGGGVLGTMAGAAMGTAGIPIPVVGSVVGGLFGGIAGALGGEALVEKLTSFLLNNEPLDPDDAKPRSKSKTTSKPSQNVSAKVSDASAFETLQRQDFAEARSDVDTTTKSLSDFESSAKSARTVQKEDAFGDMVDTVVYDDAAEQAQFDKLSNEQSGAEMRLREERESLVGGNSQFDKLQFLQRKGVLPEGESSIRMGKFVSGKFAGMTPDDAINQYMSSENTGANQPISQKSGSADVLSDKVESISQNKMNENLAGANSIQNNIAKGGDTVTSNNVGGATTTFNIIKGSGNSLANAHLPVPQAF